MKFVIFYIITFLSGIVAAVFIDGAYGIYLYEWDYFLNPRRRWWYSSVPDLRYSFIIAVVIVIGYFVRSGKYTANKFFSISHNKWLLAMVVLMGLVSFIAVWPEKHNDIYIKMLKLSMFVFLVYKMIDTPKKFERMIWVYIIGCFYIGWVAHTYGRTGQGRLEGIGPMDSTSSNSVGALLITSVPIMIFYLIEGKKYWQKVISLISLTFVLNAIILVNSRGAFLGMAASIIYFSCFILLKKIRDFKYKIKIVIGLILAIALFLYLTDNEFKERMSTISPTEKIAKKEEGGRIFYWKKGLELVKEHPFGVGAWGYQYLSPSFIPGEQLSRGTRSAHSTWIQALVGYGYIGFIIFTGFVISCFNLNRKVGAHLSEKRYYYLYLQNMSISAGFFGFLTASTFGDRLYIEVMYWLPTFIACFANIYMIKGYSEEEVLKINIFKGK